MGKYATIAFLLLLIALVSIQTFRSLHNDRVTGSQLQVVKDRLGALDKENQQLQAQIDYMGRSENLEKELRAKFNYKKPEESTIIVTQ